jgi:hypothetical protein
MEGSSMTLNLSTLYGSVGPANSDIATAVAGSVPTISAINTSVANNAPSSNNWAYLASNTSLNTTTITFSGLSGYKTYKVLFVQVQAPSSNSGFIYCRINGDTNTVYSWGAGTFSSSTTVGSIASGSSINITGNYGNIGNSQVFGGEVVVSQANTSYAKTIDFKFYGYSGGSNYVVGSAGYTGGASVSSITLFNSSTGNYFQSGTGGGFYLFGAN